MRHIQEIISFWKENDGQPLMLATIVAKDGSGYRSPGAKKIIRRDGAAAGYLSGGCLEGDIVRTALDNWDAAPFLRQFSTMSDEDRLMGYQTGCAGILSILFERLPDDISRLKNYILYGAPDSTPAAVAVNLGENRIGERITLDDPEKKPDSDCYVERRVQPLSFYVIGCGPNAAPFADLAQAMGWETTFIDYRKDYVIAERPGLRSLTRPVDEIGKILPDGPRTAVLVMTHNYEADLAVMAQLHGRSFGYLGAVGPKRRLAQMIDDLPKFHALTPDKAWMDTVRAPAGLWQRHTPEGIAFSIVAEIEQVMETQT